MEGKNDVNFVRDKQEDKGKEPAKRANLDAEKKKGKEHEDVSQVCGK